MLTDRTRAALAERLAAYQHGLSACRIIDQVETGEKLHSFVLGFAHVAEKLTLDIITTDSALSVAADLLKLSARRDLSIRPSVEYARGAEVAAKLAARVEKSAQ